MSKEFWCETWELLEEEAREKYFELFGKEPTEEEIKQYCEAHIEDRNADRTACLIDQAHDRMKYGDS